MVDVLMQTACIILFTTAILFIIIELKLHFNRSFILFGINIIILCGFSAFDIWFKPNTESNATLINIQHILFCFFIPMTLLQLRYIYGKTINELTFIFLSIAGVIAGLFATNLMIVEEGGKIRFTMLYLVVFSLYFGLSTVYLTGLITHFIRKSKGMQRKIFVYHFGALAFLCICGFLDMVNLLLQKYILDPVVSFTMFGVMGFGFILLYAFTSRLLQLIKQNKELLETFTIAYEDLRQAKALIALGKSTSLINHEIRNYLFTISFQTERVLSDPDISETSREACKKVVFAIKNLLHLNHDLLDQTRRNITSQHPPFNYVHSLQSCIDTHFASRKISFDCDFSAKDQYIYGDEERFREAIRSLLSYSLKCNATTITIKSMQDAFAILMVIEDNSPVSPHIDYTGIHLEHQPFDANERLEISIATTAIEAIGGHLTMVAKNKGTVGESGLLSYLSFPNYTAYPWKLDTEKDNVILVKEGLPKLESIVEMFHHVFVHPHVVEKAEQISYQFPSYIPVLGTRESLQPLIDNNSTSGLYFLELDKVDLLQVTDRTARTVPFTEYFILYDLLKLNRTVPEAVMRV